MSGDWWLGVGGRWYVACSRTVAADLWCRPVLGLTGNLEQVAGARLQVAGGRWQVAGSRWQVTGGRVQVAYVHNICMCIIQECNAVQCSAVRSSAVQCSAV